MGGTDQLHVGRAGGSRQRSMTPNTGPSPPIHVRSHSSSTPFFHTQWSSRVEREVPLPAGNQLRPAGNQPRRPAWNHDPGSFRSQREVQLHLDPTESGAETPGGEENAARTSARSSVFLLSDETAGIHRPEFSTGAFQDGPSPLHRLSPSSSFDAKPASSPSPSASSFQTSFDHGPVSTAATAAAATAMWKPVSWSPQVPPSSRPSASPLGSSRPRSAAARSPGPDGDAKENIFPAVVRSNKDVRTTTTTTTTNYFASQIKPPTVWQPSAVPQKSSSSTTNPSAVRSAPSPLAEVNFLLGTETRRGWENNARADEEKRGFDLPPNVNKILAPSNDYDRDAALNRDQDKKKVFVDSSFYDDPSHRYPTVEEQIRMARTVALSLTAPDNASARGHRMFMKRLETADKWVVDADKVDRLVHQLGAHLHRPPDSDPYYNPTPWSGGTAADWKAAPQGTGGMPPAPPPPPLPTTTKLFAPKRGLDDGGEFDRLRLFGEKTTHSAVSPLVCFSLAEDLRQSKGRAGRMFAKRRAKADEWTVEGGTPPAGGGVGGPDPKVLQRISGGYGGGGGEPAPVETGTVSVNAGGGDAGAAGAPVVNRLKEMVELPKAKMTPWDAVAEFGNVDLAFEHLEGISFVRPSRSNPYADQVAISLQEATQKRSGPRPGGRHLPPPTAPGSVRPQSTLSHSPMEPSEKGRARNSFTAPTANSWSQSQSTSNPTIEFSPPTNKGSTGGYRPVTFQPSSGTSSLSGGRYADL